MADNKQLPNKTVNKKWSDYSKKEQKTAIIILVIAVIIIFSMFSGLSNNKGQEATKTPEQTSAASAKADKEAEEAKAARIKADENLKNAKAKLAEAKAAAEAKLHGGINTNRDEVLAIIKVDAQKEWADDYNMVKYEIDKQTEAYDWLISQNEYLDIMKKAEAEWLNDYNMVKYEYEKQVEAYKAIQ